MRLLPLVAVAAMLVASPVLAQSSTTAPTTKSPPSATQSPAKPPAASDKSAAAPSKSTGAQTAQAMVDINTASQSDLEALPGIGPARSQAIVSNRPFKSKDELVQRKIVPQNVYDDIKDRIIARQK